MNPLDLLQTNLLSPMVLAFALGAIAVWIRSDLSVPDDLYTALSIFLLLAIGLKGGHALANASWADVARPAMATLALGIITPLLAYAVLRWLGRFDVANAAAMAAHYGSVSAVTFAATLTFLDGRGVAYEGFMPALVALLEVPAIVVALLIARLRMPAPAVEDSTATSSRSWGVVLHEVFAGRSVLLLLGGIVIGYVSTERNFERVAPLFVNLFYGALVLFLLDMGMVAARRLRDVGSAGGFLIGFAMLMPLVSGAIGVALGHASGLSFGGTVVLGVMAASASYIAAPAAVRVALPEASPAYYLTAAIGITFPFNLTLGIPAVYAMATWIRG